jgi:exodeoxyribonuclease-3
MKILTWNINGLRAALRKGALAQLRQVDADVICLQEIKARPEQLMPDDHKAFDGFYPTWNPAIRPGYSGVATFTRAQPLEIKLGLGDPEFDQEGRVICQRYPLFWLFNIYFPSGQRGMGRVAYKLDFYKRLLDVCGSLHAAGEKVILCGDFNTAHQEIDLKNWRQNVHTSGFLPEERAWIDRYLDSGFVDIYRILYPERIQYTWWAYFGNARTRNTGWRLDYFLVSKELIPHIRDTVIHDEIAGSDHCPVSLIID